MKLDLSCPVELRGYVLSYSENAVSAEVRLYNLSRRRVAAFEGVAKWRSSSAERSIACPFALEHLRAPGESIFHVTLDNPRLANADSLEILFTCVRFEDGMEEWRAGEGPFAELTQLPPISSDDLELLRKAAGSDAVCFPTTSETYLRCVCGRLNRKEDCLCVRCHRNLEETLRHSPDSVRGFTELSAPVSPTEVCEPLPRRQKRRFRSALALALAVLALAGFTALRLLPGSSTTAIVHAESGVSSEK